MMENNKSLAGKTSDRSTVADPCCCECCNSTCSCERAREISNNEDCCLCIPLYIGMVLIEYITLIYIIGLSIYVITLYGNDSLDAYYIIVIMILELLLFIALILLCAFDRSKSKAKRMWPVIAIIVFMLTVIAITIWIMWYYLTKYKYEHVYHGQGDLKTGSYT